MTTPDQDTDIGKINLRPRQQSLDGTHLNWLIRQWVKSISVRVSAKTASGYRSRVEWFCEWWQRNGGAKEWLLTQQDLLDFEVELRRMISPTTGEPLAYHTRRDVLRRLRQALHWAWTKHYTEFDYSQWVPQPEGGPPLRRAANVEQLIRLMDAAAHSPYPTRDRAILALMIGMGLRASEVTNLNIEDVTIHADQSGYARILGKRTRANPSGKRDAALDAATGRFVVAHLDSSAASNAPLFRNGRNGKRLAYMTIYRITKLAIAAAGLSNVIQACHDLRRAFCTYYLRNNHGDQAADTVRRQLGHASFAQTSDYNLMDVEDLRQNMISPLAEYRGD